MNKQFLRQAQQLQARMAQVQEELANITVEGSAGGGAVKVVMTGHQVVQSVTISPEAVDPQDVGLLEDMVTAAFNQALKNSQDLAQKRLGAITGGMKIPGLM